MEDTAVILQNEHTCLVMESRGARLPVVRHWGDPLGAIDQGMLTALRGVDAMPPVHNGLSDSDYELAVLPEQWCGWTGHPGISGSRDGADWAPRFELVDTHLDGAAVTGFVTASTGEVIWTAEDRNAGLRVAIVVRLEQSGLVRMRATLTNMGAPGYQLDQLLLALPVPARATEVLDMAGRWGKERVPQRTTMPVGSHWREGRHGRTGADAATAIHLGEPNFGFRHGKIWGLHVAWSGNHIHYAEKILTGEQVLGGGELLLPGEVILNANESYQSPWLCASHGTGLDQLAAQNHGWLRSAHPVDTHRPVTLNVWEAVYFDHDKDRLIDLAQRAHRVGIERFVLDDGWFGKRRSDHAGLGDWVVSSDAWPDGLHPLVDAVTGLGMQFGLWFEPEMVNPDSDVARAHPEWVMRVPGRVPLTSRHQWVMNLAHPDAYRHVRDQMMALLDEYAISYIKWDHNRDVTDGGSALDGRPRVHAQTLAFYRLVEELKAAHPGLEIESCSSGGARVDLEVMAHCDRVWVSDNIDPSDRQQMMRWTAQLLPPELLGSHIASGASHTTGRTHSIDHRAATAVFGHLGVEWDLAQATNAELAALEWWITWYKQHRDILCGGRVVRVDVPVPGVYWHGTIGARGAIFCLTLLERPSTWSIGRLVIPGLEPDTVYRVQPLVRSGGRPWGPWTMSGSQLERVGIDVTEPQPEHAQVVMVEACGRNEHTAVPGGR